MKRKKGKSQVLTDTPVKNALIKELSAKKKRKDGKPVLTEKKKPVNPARTPQRKCCIGHFLLKQRIPALIVKMMVFDDDSNLDIDINDCTADKDETSVGDFILVEFLGKRVKKYFAGEVKEDTSEGYVVTFPCRKFPSWEFVFLEAVDESLVSKRDIVMKLPVPRISGGTEHAAKALVFDISLSKYLVETMSKHELNFESEKFEKQYFEELKDGKVTAASKFNFAFCLVKSRYAEDIKNGIKFLEELIIKGDEEARRDYIFYLAYGHFKLKDYPKALEYTETLLAMEPNNRQAMDMKTNIKKKMEIGKPEYSVWK
ncbi:hypothetical protein QYM36_004891 [Artemia franciscana]|uniref:Tetratricopeptide repeat protein n=1 Tax=Artemia franciscana TaxID=6661 RepID=A0AA88L6X3_ARTSF|nr:hypothetical protein QYM36_004891 [Artemia franciscana]